MNTENSKMNKIYKFVLNLSQILGLISSTTHVPLQNLSIYPPPPPPPRRYKNNKLKILSPNGMMNLIISLKGKKHKQQFPLFIFTSIELIID